jgi:hypothetical protein
VKVEGIKPEVKVCLMTAFEINKTEFSKVLSSIKIDEFIQKPIRIEKLSEIVE